MMRVCQNNLISASDAANPYSTQNISSGVQASTRSKLEHIKVKQTPDTIINMGSSRVSQIKHHTQVRDPKLDSISQNRFKVDFKPNFSQMKFSAQIKTNNLKERLQRYKMGKRLDESHDEKESHHTRSSMVVVKKQTKS